MSRMQARRFNPSPVAQPGYTLCVSQCSKGSQSNHCCSCAETSASSACFHLDSTIQAFTSERTDHHQSVTISILYRDSLFFFLSPSSERLKQAKNTASLALACSGTPTHPVCVWTRSADWYIFFFCQRSFIDLFVKRVHSRTDLKNWISLLCCLLFWCWFWTCWTQTCKNSPGRKRKCIWSFSGHERSAGLYKSRGDQSRQWCLQ